MKLSSTIFLAAIMFALSFQANAACETVTVSWTPPTENVDGSELTNLSGYNLFYTDSLGNDKTISIPVGKESHKIVCVEFGIASFYMKALAGDSESAPSETVQKDVVYTGQRHRDWLRLHEMRTR